MSDQSLKIARKVTAHCFIDENGRVVFMRGMNGQRKPVVLATIYDAISQCFHILDRIAGEALDFYNSQPSLYIKGERDEMRNVFMQLQSAIAVLSNSQASKKEAIEIQRGFEQIVVRLNKVRNRHKQLAQAYLRQTTGPRSNKPQSLGEILAPAKAHLEAVERFQELNQISQGVIVQARALIKISLETEKRLRRIYELIVLYEQQAHSWLVEIEKCQRESGVRCLPAHVRALCDIADDVARPKINKVTNAFKGVALVEPYKSRIESAEVQSLTHLHEYLEFWEAGNQALPLRFVNAFGRARTKLKRLVRMPQAQADERLFAKHYATVRT